MFVQLRRELRQWNAPPFYSPPVSTSTAYYGALLLDVGWLKCHTLCECKLERTCRTVAQLVPPRMGWDVL